MLDAELGTVASLCPHNIYISMEGEIGVNQVNKQIIMIAAKCTRHHGGDKWKDPKERNSGQRELAMQSGGEHSRQWKSWRQRRSSWKEFVMFPYLPGYPTVI